MFHESYPMLEKMYITKLKSWMDWVVLRFMNGFVHGMIFKIYIMNLWWMIMHRGLKKRMKKHLNRLRYKRSGKVLPNRQYLIINKKVKRMTMEMLFLYRGYRQKNRSIHFHNFWNVLVLWKKKCRSMRMNSICRITHMVCLFIKICLWLSR